MAVQASGRAQARVRLAAGCAFALLGGGGPLAHAHPGERGRDVPSPPLVVVVARAIQDPMVARVRDELELLGMTVKLRVAAGGDRPLATLAATEHAAAVVWVEPRPAEIVIWVDPTAEQEPYGPPTELRVSDSLLGEPRPELLALRAVELLRGRLLPVEDRAPSASPEPGQSAPAPGAPAPGAPTPPTTATRDTRPPGPAPSATAAPPPTSGTASTSTPAGREGARPTPGSSTPNRAPEPAAGPGAPRAWLGVAPTVALSPGGVPAAFQLRVGAGTELGWRLGVEAAAWIPTAPTHVSEPEGNIGVRTLLLEALLTVRLNDEETDFGALVGAGLGASALWFEGEATPPYQSAGGTHWAVAPCVELAGRYRFIDWLALRADVAVALIRPEPILRAAGRDVASWGQPVVLLGAGLEVLP